MKVIYSILATLLIHVAAIPCLNAQQKDVPKPKLVIGIVVDQLRTDYISQLENRFGSGGFMRLINNGAYFENVEFASGGTDPTVNTTILFTGSYPNINGVSASYIFDTKTQRPMPIFTDHEKIGNFTDETFSPQSIAVSTLADEVRISSAATGYVYAVAPGAQQAIALAGHAANSASWINDVSGFWATTTFYKDFPSSLSFRNYNTSLATRLDTLKWQPILEADKYTEIPNYRRNHPFRYVYTRNDKDRFRKFKQSPLVNEEITNVAINYITSLGLGKRDETDMLNIAYTLAPYPYTNDNDFRHELQDAYIRLDRQIERLLKAADESVGKDNVLVFVASTGYFNDNRVDDPRFNVPTGEFNTVKAKSLLNMYLMALYGNGEWVRNYYNGHLYLNQDFIKQQGKSLEEIRVKSAEFLRKMSGVAAAYSIDDIINNPASPRTQKIHIGTNHVYSGDVIIQIKPGWQVVNPTYDDGTLMRDNSVNTPVIIYGRHIPTTRYYDEIDATFLAPTIARLLGIRAPNSAAHKPVIIK